jgi:20S proteasome alpha/beta subunit
MSLCIAAVADFKQAMVLCFDRKLSTDIVSSETELKFDMFPYGIAALFSGEAAGARELIDAYRYRLIKDRNALRPSGELSLMTSRVTALEDLRIPPRTVKRRMIESHIQARLGLSYDEFLQKGKDQIEPDTRRQLTSEIYQMQMNVELLLCGFLSEQPSIFRFAWERLELYEHFACIGAGATAAEHSLHSRAQNYQSDLATTLYNVFEAKRSGEQAPSVGTKTIMLIGHRLAEPGMRVTPVNKSGFTYLEKQFKKYGPKGLPALGTFPKEGLTDSLDFKI